MRRSLPWLVALPLMLAGSQAAHALSYVLVFPEASVRSRTLTETGHGYLEGLPFALGMTCTVALLALALTAFDAAHGARRVRMLPAAAVAVFPPAAFALQEVLELSLHTGTLGWRAVLAPTFLPGLLLQLPFAAAGYLATRLLLRTAERVGRAICGAITFRSVSDTTPVPAAVLRDRLGRASHAARAPPCAS
jgi:hypothetical protein